MEYAFEHLHVEAWRQFSSVDIDFSKRATVITGANGTGKTTLLTVLVRHFGWLTPYVATPRRVKRDGRLVYDSDFKKELAGFARPSARLGDSRPVGYLDYLDASGARSFSARAELGVPVQASPVYDVVLAGQEAVHGVYLPSHRATPTYAAVSEIPTYLGEPSQMIDEYEGELKQRLTDSYAGHSPSYRLKRSFMALGALGFGNAVVSQNARAVQSFRGFEEILRVVLPDSLGFRGLKVELPEVVLDTAHGQFSLDGVSGGVFALIDTVWRIHMRSLQNPRLFVVMDEPENHLHPELQRSLLMKLGIAFPAARFIVSTHSPFIVGSFRESNVYALRRDSQGGVFSDLLDTESRAGTSNEVLREVLGLEYTIPIWAEQELERHLHRFEAGELNDAAFDDFRREVEQLGMAHLFPDLLAEALKRRRLARD